MTTDRWEHRLKLPVDGSDSTKIRHAIYYKEGDGETTNYHCTAMEV